METKTSKRRKNAHRSMHLLLLFASTVILAFGTFATISAHNEAVDKDTEKFEARSELALDTIVSKLNNYNDLLYIGRGLLQTNESVSQDEWNRYYRDQDVFTRYEGISSILYVKRVDNDSVQSFVNSQRDIPEFRNLTVDQKPNTDYGLISRVASDNDLTGAIGFDVFSEETRKAVYDQALATQRPTASPKIRFSTGFDGVFMTLPVTKDSENDGFVVVSFRLEQFVRALLPADNEKYYYSIKDISDPEKPASLYETAGLAVDNRLAETTYTDVGSRRWSIQLVNKEPRDSLIFGTVHTNGAIIGAITILTVGLLLTASRFFHLRSKS